MKKIAEHRKFEHINDYFAFEEKSEVRHEYYSENLFEMAASTKLHNQIVFYITLLFRQLLLHKKFDISSEQVKVFIKSENIFFYPDVMIALPEQQEYYASFPILIVEVFSENSRKFDLVDKFLQYQKIETLQYYLLIEPDKHLVIMYLKTDDGDWETRTYTGAGDVISLPKFNISIALKDIYQI